MKIDFGAEDFDGDEEGYEFAMAEISFIPQNTSELTEEKDINSMVKLIEALEDNDDIQETYHN